MKEKNNVQAAQDPETKKYHVLLSIDFCGNEEVRAKKLQAIYEIIKKGRIDETARLEAEDIVNRIFEGLDDENYVECQESSSPRCQCCLNHFMAVIQGEKPKGPEFFGADCKEGECSGKLH